MPDVAGALSQIGVARGWVLRGGDGLDEVTTACATRVAEVRQGHPNQLLTISPRDFGLDERPTAAARAASVEDNAAMVRAVLSGQRPRRGARPGGAERRGRSACAHRRWIARLRRPCAARPRRRRGPGKTGSVDSDVAGGAVRRTRHKAQRRAQLPEGAAS